VSTVRLIDGYDGVLLDLDGTMLRGTSPVPGAVDVVRELRNENSAVGYVTNNAARSAAEVAAQLLTMGFDVTAERVVTSADAAAAVLAERLDPGSAVLVVGTESLAGAVRAAGLVAVRQAAAEPAAVVQGHSPHTAWPNLAEACLAIRDGVLWVACNVDPTLPTERGELPGNGAMVAALRTATGKEPEVAGKPSRRLLDQAASRIGSTRPLVVGDRLDTDIAGARAAGLDSLLVLTGVTDAATLLAAPRGMRPTFVAADLAALRRPAGASKVTARPRWQVRVNAQRLQLVSVGGGASAGRGDPVAALIALCAARWPAGQGPVEVEPADDTARRALAALGLVR
jgi:HAD superfamily hydrolase (TIGR01450 family)